MFDSIIMMTHWQCPNPPWQYDDQRQRSETVGTAQARKERDRRRLGSLGGVSRFTRTARRRIAARGATASEESAEK